MTDATAVDLAAPVERYLRPVAAVCSVGAAIVHFAVMGQHWSEWWLYGVFFMVCAWAQVAFAAVVLRGGSRRLLLAGGIGQLAVVVLWLVTRTSGLPFGPDAGIAEAAGLPDTLSSVLEILAGTAAVGLTVRWFAGARVARELGAGALAVTVAAVAALTTLSLTPGYAEHGHDDGTTATAGMTMSMSSGSATSGTSTTSGTSGTSGSGMSGMTMAGDCHTMHMDTDMVGHEVGNCTDAPVTLAQEAAANKLIQQTKAGVAKWPTIAAAEKAGYKPTNISGPLVHMGNLAWDTDSDVLDPAHPEDLVYLKIGNRSMLLGAMYVMPKLGEQGPLIGGALTSWHIHTNLCVDPTKRTAFNTLPDGSCAAGSKVGPTTQMLHVWTVDYPGGAFADIDSASIRTVAKASWATASRPDDTQL